MRILRFNKSTNAFKGEITEDKLVSARVHSEINGEHSLTLVTTQKLDKGERLFIKQPKDEEYVVVGSDEEHTIGDTVVRTYYCVWSLQEDLQGVMVSVMPGVGSSDDGTPQRALDALLSTQTRWSGYSYLSYRISKASMYDRSAWDALSTFLEAWGGEVYTRFTTDTTGAVTQRELCVTDHVGSRDVAHRFDFGRDMTSIKRSFPDTPLYCRITPRGKGEATEGGGYGRKITIASVNSGKDYLENGSAMVMYRLMNPDGTYQYPTLKVENSDCETPAELKAWAESVLESYTTPQIVYTVSSAGFISQDLRGVSNTLGLGDEVQVSDHLFGADPLFGPEPIKLESRIVAVDYDLLETSNNVYTIGSSKEPISTKFASLGGSGGGKESRETNGDSYTDGDVYVSGNVECGTINGLSLKTVTNTTISDIVTAAADWTITYARADVWGKMCMVSVGAKKSSAISVPANGDIANQTIGTLKAGYRPIQMASGVCTTEIGTMVMSTTGTITWQNAIGSGSARTIAADTELYFRATYFLA